MGIGELYLGDYRKDKKKSTNNEKNNYIQKHFTHLEQLSSLFHNVMESLF
ncbi:hypothetical protein RhiirB3_459685 [Rhizophagus irregularis]|nr:hypothetical protein RhiirB3_459685 [Rhizophagus irregularis]